MDTAKHDRPLWFLDHDGICGATARSIDWASTSLGRPESWPMSLKGTVAMMLHSRHPMFLWWGKELIQIYNDAYLPSFGKGKHPLAMGQRGVDCWQEIWPIIWPQIDDVMQRRRSSWNEDHLVPIYRNGRLEEVYWTYGYSPVFDECGAVAGTLVVCTETTGRVISDRRLRAIQVLAESTNMAGDRASLFDNAAAALGQFPNDIPFAQIYMTQAHGGVDLAMSVGLNDDARKRLTDTFQPCLSALQRNTSRLDDAQLIVALPPDIPGLPWPEPSTQAYIVPLTSSTAAQVEGWLVFGISPRLAFNTPYREHFEHLAGRVSHALERQQAELERERLLGEIRAEQQRLATLFAQAPAFMCVLEGPHHVFSLANQRYLELVGQHDIVGKRLLDVLPEVEEQGFIKILDRVYQTGEPYVGIGVALELQHGPSQSTKALYVDFVYQALRGAGGAIVGIVVLGVDQTDRHQAEQAMKDAERRKDEFLAILAHELRNPLAPIANRSQLLKMSAHDPNAVRKASAAILRQVEQMVRLIDDLLDVSRIGSGKIALRRADIELAPVIRQALDANQSHFQRRRTHVDVTIPVDAIFVYADAARLGQVVGNLLHNAAKFTGQGGHVWLAVERAEHAAVIRVRDDGIGIESGQLSNIFQMFTQADTSLERTQGGLGIGLGLVRSLVEMHGGSVTACSDGTGAGSEFVVRIPTVDDASIEYVGTVHDADAVAPGIRVLVVDDNRDACDSMEQLLCAIGYETQTAYDGLSAVQKAEQYGPHVILLDLGMPRLNGYDACRRIRQQPWGRAMTVIALTGWGKDEDRHCTKQAGFDAHLVKPVDITELKRLLASVDCRRALE